ncbi:hypothetical protein D6D54_05095 [Spiroplasma poulsonii]|uniref:Agmatine deiminase n=2 Tax=Spiroplasma poulsonii TaxID=2138 RepID=A0A433EQN4_9MOLU|nr:hypothetical protein [Spiroplasma poulsonii]RUP76813.1 hypothetical protein D6D54_05095 [Spiroplasma poulsonii]
MLWPHMKDNWHDDSRPARATFAKIANAISKYEPVKMIINYEDSTEARAMLDENVILVEIKHFDSWDRDMGPLYVINKQGERRVVNFQFNGWGMQNVPEINTPDFKWDYTVDDQVSKVISENSDFDYYQAPMVLEGGSIHQDGDGTIYTTEECLLNPNRNPHLTKTQIEEYLKQ